MVTPWLLSLLVTSRVGGHTVDVVTVGAVDGVFSGIFKYINFAIQQTSCGDCYLPLKQLNQGARKGVLNTLPNKRVLT